MAVGAAGSMTATAPVEWTIGLLGWRPLFVILSLLAMVAIVLLWIRAPRGARGVEIESLTTIARGVGRVLRSRVFWSVAPLSVMHQGGYLAIQSLWAGPWLRDVALLERTALARHLLILAFGMGLGYLGIGYVAQRLAKRGHSPLGLWVGTALLFQTVQFLLALGWTAPARELWFAFGLFGASGMLSYVLVSQCFPVAMAGRVNTGLNLLVFTSAFALQAGTGAVIQRFPAGTSHFSSEGYRVAFGAVVAFQAAAMVWLLATSSWRRQDPSGSLFRSRSTP
jgi:predicted MFS family arabinose efflux permease